MNSTSKRSTSSSLKKKSNVCYELERVFNHIDEDKDGKLSPSELQTCLRTIGQDLSSEDAEAVVVSSDSDGDGLLGFEDFVRLIEAEEEEEQSRSLREAFGMYETTDGGGGFITPKSLKRMLSRLGERTTIEKCEVMIKRFDLDGDGVISFDEFKLMMML
ncbi:putative calcium-binding protein CML19 [Acorus gramineus]|uniref:Calcium-binding protein CML19 n=1 Tax=Acorus gramineus TaxID=55184 RepID=A0AAV9A616_ACOGR|nr:putative calcium-binding protein CML19 [Acorus gramineus]